MDGPEDNYVQPTTEMSAKLVTDSHDSGISSVSSSGKANPAFLQTPDTEMETSFSDEQKLSSVKPYIPPNSPNGMDGTYPAPLQHTNSEQDLNLPPPPGHMWAPSTQSHSADGVIGYPPWMSSYPYVHPSMMHPSMQSLPHTTSGSLTAEEHQVLLKFRQDRVRGRSTSSYRDSVSSPDGEGGHLYEELPGYLYKTHNQVRLKQSPMDRKLPPHLPPLSSLPSGSQASLSSGLDLTDMDTMVEKNPAGKRKANPLYEANTVSPGYIDDRNSDIRHEENKRYMEQMQVEEDRCCPSHRCYCVTLLLVAIVAMAALLVTLLVSLGIVNMKVLNQSGSKVSAVTGAASGAVADGNRTSGNSITYIYNNSSDPEIYFFIHELKNNISTLLQITEAQEVKSNQLLNRVLILEMERQQLVAALNQTQSALSMKIDGTISQFSSLNGSLWSEHERLNVMNSNLADVNVTLRRAVADVAKSPGPTGPEGLAGAAGLNGTRGPSGYLDPTLCKHDFIYRPSNSLSTSVAFKTGVVSDTNQTKIIGATCAWEGFTNGYLTVVDDETEPEKKNYECTCGIGPGSQRKKCTLHYWICTMPAD